MMTDDGVKLLDILAAQIKFHLAEHGVPDDCS